MVRDKLATYTQDESVDKVSGSARSMSDCMSDIIARGDIDSPMDVITEIWNSDMSDYDTAQMICALGMHLSKFRDYDDMVEDTRAEENMSALKKKWGM